MVEFALALPLLLVVLFGIFDFGRAIYMSNTISNAARVGNRVAIVDQTPAVIRAAVKQEAVAVALADADISITVECAQIGCLALIEVTTDYVPATPIIGSLIGTLQLVATSEMPIERVHQT